MVQKIKLLLYDVQGLVLVFDTDLYLYFGYPPTFYFIYNI